MPNKFTMCVYIPSAVCHLLHMTDSHESSLYIHWWCIRQLYVHDARQKKNAHGDLLSNSPWFRKQKLLLLGHVSNIRLFVYEIGTCSVTKQPVSVRVKTVLLKVRNMVAMHANRVIPVSSEYNTWRWWIGQRLSFSNWSGEKKNKQWKHAGVVFFCEHCKQLRRLSTINAVDAINLLWLLERRAIVARTFYLALNRWIVEIKACLWWFCFVVFIEKKNICRFEMFLHPIWRWIDVTGLLAML